MMYDFFGFYHIFMGEQDQKMSQAGLKPALQLSMLGIFLHGLLFKKKFASSATAVEII